VRKHIFPSWLGFFTVHFYIVFIRYEAKLPPNQKINEQSAQGVLEQFIRDKYDGKRWYDASAVPGVAPAASVQQFTPAPAAAPRPQHQQQQQQQANAVVPQAPQSNFFDFGDSAPTTATVASSAPVAQSGGLLDDLLGTSSHAPSGFDAPTSTQPKASTADIMGMYRNQGMGGMQMGGMQGQQGFGGQGMGMQGQQGFGGQGMGGMQMGGMQGQQGFGGQGMGMQGQQGFGGQGMGMQGQQGFGGQGMGGMQMGGMQGQQGFGGQGMGMQGQQGFGGQGMGGMQMGGMRPPMQGMQVGMGMVFDRFFFFCCSCQLYSYYFQGQQNMMGGGMGMVLQTID
jgi:hypothetical protein